MAFIGSCVLCVVIHNNSIYVANLGDCKARLLRKGNKSYQSIKISKTYNACKDYEQERLKKKFQDEDIIVGKGTKPSYYVKGRLQPTKTLGDFYLKHKEFNEPNLLIEQKYIRRTMDDFNGPYIDYLPDIQKFELSEEDDFIIIATDGLWDNLSSEEVASIAYKNRTKKESIVNSLWQEALKRAAFTAGLSVEETLAIPVGSLKRSIHDDITIMVVDLKNQINYNIKTL